MPFGRMADRDEAGHSPDLGVDEAVAGIIGDVWVPELAAKDTLAGHARFLHHTSGSMVLYIAEGFGSEDCRMRQRIRHHPAHDFGGASAAPG